MFSFPVLHYRPTSSFPILRYRGAIFYVSVYLVIIAVAYRAIAFYLPRSPDLAWTAGGLVLAYALLLPTERVLQGRSAWYPYVYMSIQTGIVTALLLLRPPLDFFATLLLPLSGKAMLMYDRRIGLVWIGIFTVVMAATLGYAFGLESPPLILLFGAGYFFIASYTHVTIQAESPVRRARLC